MITKESLTALKGAHETVKVITTKQGSPFNETKKNKEALLELGIDVDQMVKVTEYDCFAGSDLKFDEIYEQRAGEKKETTRNVKTNSVWVEGLEGILLYNSSTGNHLLRIFTDKNHKAKSHYLYKGQLFDAKDPKYAPFLKVRKEVNEAADGLLPLTLTLSSVSYLEVDGKKVA